MPFCEQSLQFLFENYIKDDKNWYAEHKDDYRRFIAEPFAELITAMEPVFSKIDEKIIVNPKKVSRLYRDARYSKGGTIFRDHVWCSFKRKAGAFESIPEFYFEISPRGFSYGCGFYCPDRSIMDAMREMIISDDKVFKKAFRAYSEQDVFSFYGEMYKRNKYPEQSAEKCFWLNRKTMGVCCDSGDYDLLYSGALVGKVAEDYMKIAPLYDFFMAGRERACAV